MDGEHGKKRGDRSPFLGPIIVPIKLSRLVSFEWSCEYNAFQFVWKPNSTFVWHSDAYVIMCLIFSSLLCIFLLQCIEFLDQTFSKKCTNSNRLILNS